MQFYTINDSDRKKEIARNIIAREQEIHSYELNVLNYETILASLPQGEWPALIEDYKSTPIQDVPVDLHDMVNDYQFRERVRHLLSTEKHEMNKSVKVYEALLTHLTPEEIPDLIKLVQDEMKQNQPVTPPQ